MNTLFSTAVLATVNFLASKCNSIHNVYLLRFEYTLAVRFENASKPAGKKGKKKKEISLAQMGNKDLAEAYILWKPITFSDTIYK